MIASIPAETMVMYAKETGKGVRLSVCDPNLNIKEKAYTTKEPSRPIYKKILTQRSLDAKEFNGKCPVGATRK